MFLRIREEQELTPEDIFLLFHKGSGLNIIEVKSNLDKYIQTLCCRRPKRQCNKPMRGASDSQKLFVVVVCVVVE